MIINELKSIDLNELTPIEALTELFNLRKMIDEKWGIKKYKGSIL